MLMVH